MQLPTKEPLKSDTKPSVVPPYISANGTENANQGSQFADKKNAHSNNTVKHDNPLNNEQIMDDPKDLNDNTFAMRMANKIENWSPSTAKYAKLSIFGCKVSINHLYQ